MSEVFNGIMMLCKNFGLRPIGRVFEFDDRSAPFKLEKPHFEKFEIIPALLLPKKLICLRQAELNKL